MHSKPMSLLGCDFSKELNLGRLFPLTDSSINLRIPSTLASLLLLGFIATSCENQGSTSLAKSRLASSYNPDKTDDLTIIKKFDLTKEVSWSADATKEKFQGLALSIPLKAIDSSDVTMTMALKASLSLSTQSYSLMVKGDKKIESSINLVLPSLVADGFLLSTSSDTLVKFTAAASGQSRYLAKKDFSKLDNGIVVSLAEWGVITLEKLTNYVAMDILSPTENSYVSAGSVSNFAVAGSCEVEGSTISFSTATTIGGDKTELVASNSATCKSSQWAATINLSSISDGAVTLYADNKVLTGQKSLQKSLALIKDTISPAVTLATSSNSSTNASPIPMTVTFSEPVVGFSLSDVTIINGNAADLNGSGSVYTFSVYPVTNGSVSATIPAAVVTDAAGNANSASSAVNVTFNSAAPTATISSASTTSTAIAPIPVTVTFSGVVTGFIATDVTISNASISNFSGSGTTYTFDLTPATQGLVTVDISAGAAVDGSGSNSLAAAQFVRTYDTTSPTVTISSSVTPTVTNQTPIPVTVTFNEVVTDFFVTDLTISNGTASSFAGSGTTYTLNVTPTANGAVTIDVAGGVAQDGAGNTNTAATQLSKTYDGTAPTVSVSAPAASSYVNNSNLAALTVSGSCSENTRSVTVHVSDGTTTVHPGAAVTCATGSSPNWTTTVNATSLSNGTLSVTAIHADAAGNSTTSSNIAITKDAASPNAATAMGWSQSSPTTATSLTAAWTVSTSSDLASQAIQFFTGSACNTVLGSLVAIPSSVTAASAFTAGGEGYYSYQVTSYDVAGNSTVSACSSPITVATTAVTTNSTITGTSPVTADGSSTSTVTITLKNANNEAVVGVTPTFSATNTGSTNSYAACSATNISGVSTCTMTSTRAEVKTLSIATPISKTDGSLTFQNGPAVSVAFSTQPSDGYQSVALSPQPVVTIRDANANTVTTGVDATATVTLTLQSGAGSLAGTVSMAAVAGVADFSGKGLNLSALGSKTLRTTKASTTGSGGTATLTADSNTFEITVGVPVLSAQSHQDFPSSYLNQGSTFTKDFDNTITNSDSGMNYACTFDQVVDGAVASGTACSALAGTASFDTSTGVMSWTPNHSVFGPFEIKVTGTNTAGTGNRVFVIAVRPAYVTTNLIGNWDAQFADLIGPVSGSVLTWKDLTVNGNDGAISSSSNVTWSGSGTYTSPYSVGFNGSGKIDYGSTVANSSTNMMFSSWVNPSNVSSSSEAVILGNSGNATGNGFTVRQTPSYRDVVMSLNPVGYWRLGESSGNTATDLGSSGNSGTYQNSPTLVQTGALTGDDDTSVNFNGSTNSVSINNPSGLQNQNFSISLWVKPGAQGAAIKTLFDYDHASSPYQGWVVQSEDATTNSNYYLAYCDNTNVFQPASAIGAGKGIPLTSGVWQHLVYIKNGAALLGYKNGVLAWSGTATNSAIFYGTNRSAAIGRYIAGSGRNFNGPIDEVSVFSSALTAQQVSSLYEAGTTGKKMDFVIGKSYKDIVLADSPVGYWRLGETSGTTAKDISGSGLNGTYINGASLNQAGGLTANPDAAASFDGVNDYVDFGDPTNGAFDFGANDFSIEFWVYRRTGCASSNWASTWGVNKWNTGGSPGTNEWSVGFCNGTGSTNQIAFGIESGSTIYSVASGSTMNNNSWYHVVATREGTNIKLYVNGSLSGTTAIGAVAVNNVSGRVLRAANSGLNSSYLDGILDEIALYNSALSATQVSYHYNAGLGTYGGTCTSVSGFSSSTWNFISGLFDGSTASFYVNGRQECTVSSVAQTLSSASTNLTVGSTATGTKGWVGYLSDLLLYGTSNGSSVATAANIKTNFDATADRYRQNPVGNIVTNGLVLSLDAANAKQGLRPFTNGCAAMDFSWFDLSSSAFTGTLTNFASCGASSGWIGTGVAADPFRLAFDGTNDYVSTNLTLDLSQTFTWVAWLKITSNSGYNTLIGQGNGAGTGFYFTVMGSDYDTRLQIVGSAQWTKGTTALQTGQWYHVALVRNANGAGNVKMYLNGAYDVGLTGAGAIETYTPTDSTSTLEIGRTNYGGNYSYGVASKTMGQVLIYNRPLTVSEISQNCNAHKARFSGATCN